MRKLLILSLLSLALSGCVTTGTNVGSTWSSLVAQLRSAATATCRYLPDASSAANILATYISGGVLAVGAIEAAAASICAALVPTSQTLRARTAGGAIIVRVRGVILRGHYVR